MSSPVTAYSILQQIKSKESTAFEALYDNYAAVMLGAIQLFIKDKNKAERVLEDLFLNFTAQDFENVKECSLLFFIYKYTLDFTMQSLSEEGLFPDISEVSHCPKLVQLLFAKKRLNESETLMPAN
jgi:hypothetical protein